MNLGKGVKVTRLLAATAMGTASVNAAALDMSGYEGVLFVLEANNITDGGLAIKAQTGALPDGSDAVDLASTAVQDSNGKVALLDIYKPLQRYLRAVVVRGGATGAAFDSVLAIQYGPRVKPTVHDPATVANYEVYASPLPGNA